MTKKSKSQQMNIIDSETMLDVDDILAHPEKHKGYDTVEELMRDLDE